MTDRAPEETAQIVVEAVAVKDVQAGEEVLVAGTLGLVRKTVFSTMSSEEDGCCLNFTDGDSFRMPSRDYEVARVVPAVLDAPARSSEEGRTSV